MSQGNDTKRDESAPGAVESALGSFGTGARARFGPTLSVEGTVTGRWVDEAVQNGQPPSIRATAYVNRETARKLLHGMVKEFREQARVSIACGFDDDAERYEEWAAQCEACLGLTLGGGGWIGTHAIRG